MKYTIMGFRQEKLVQLGLDILDAIILRYFVDFKEAKGMRIKIVDGQAYYWIRYDGVLKELPILNIKKCTVQSRFFKLRDAGVLTHQVIREGGTYSYFGIGEKYTELITSGVNLDDDNGGRLKESCSYDNLAEEKSQKSADKDSYRAGYKLNSVDVDSYSVDENIQCREENLQGYQCESTTNNPSTKDPSIININNPVFLKKKAFEIIEYLNLQTGKKFRSDTKVTLRLIKAKFQEGFTMDDFRNVIDNMKIRWTGTKFQEYLAPTTLFAGKFETYLNQGKEVQGNGFKRGNVVMTSGVDKASLKEKLRNIVLREDM
ncbi:MAG: conserved phage C-terminal domain-containing protein [Clostridium sp.]|uniref:conserved phage C-terminal domain-containing protein n=1 Tax=Clostridium sp. TaxID=1506 RepID=UPI0030332288